MPKWLLIGAIQAERERDIRAAILVRRLREAQPRPVPRAVRRIVGRSMVRVGLRLAGDPLIEPARSR